MNDPTRTDLLGSEIHTVVLWLLAFGLVLLWVGAHWLKKRLATKPLQLAAFAARILLGTVAIWVLWQAVSRFLLLATDWSLWTNAFVGALAMEIVLLLYGLERRIISRKLSQLLLWLRLGAVASVLAILVQPVWARESKRTIERKVVVLVDDSGSMQIADQQMSVEERLALAQFYGIDGVKGRADLSEKLAVFTALDQRMEKAKALLEIPEGYGADGEGTVAEREKPAVLQLIKETQEAAAALRRALRERPKLPSDADSVAEDLQRALRGGFDDRLREAANRMEEGKPREAQRELRQAHAAVQKIASRAALLGEASDQVFYQIVAPAVRQRIDDLAAKTRAELARETMQRPRDNGKNLLDQLKEKYGVQLVRFGKKSAEVADWQFPAAGEDEEFRLRTDLTGALKKLSEAFEPENLAGVLLLSDARHNADQPVDDVARSLGNQGSPICPVVIGSHKGSKDAAIVTVGAPQTIFQGDRIRTRVELRADGLRGQTVKIRLLQEDAEVASQEITVPDDSFRTTVRLAYQPKEAAIFRHTVRIDPIDGELFKNNNAWSFQTAVSDDRTSVLLIDDRPRWEFRYLRNLFDSRDKSVHLQYVLLHPDLLENETRPVKPATASAKFGDSEATRLPDNPEEWKKFDAIILGDVAPAALGEQTWETIRDCVANRGALLVLIAGPHAMPHAFSNETFRELCPVFYRQETRSLMTPPEPAYHLRLTGEGRNNLIFLQSQSGLENARIWENMPLLRWRHPIAGVKDGAEILAYAKAAELDSSGQEIPAPEIQASIDPAALTKQKEEEKRNALVVTTQFGSGKVAMLNFDHTWRFRYGVGDTYHHRFWGQMLRWGTGENLRAGTSLVRLGSDKLTYEPGERLQIIAKLVEEDYRPVVDAEVYATIYKGADKVARRRLEFRKDSHGMYEAGIEGISDPGDYSLELTGNEVERLLGPAGTEDRVTTKFSIASAANPVEFGDLSVDRELAVKVASLTGGIVTTPKDATRVLEIFGEPSQEKFELKETRLWDNWGLLALAVGFLTSEWVARRRGGLV